MMERFSYLHDDFLIMTICLTKIKGRYEKYVK